MTPSRIDRRDLLRYGALSAAASGARAFVPFLQDEAKPPAPLVPEDKGFDAAWLASLTERGEAAVYEGEDLRYVGMPVGGICAGQLYLAGDGRLWHWDIFNTPALDSSSPHYVEPRQVSSPVTQGFAIQVAGKGATQLRTLDKHGFNSVRFRGAYPIGRVDDVFVTTTYGHWTQGEEPYIVSVRFTLKELDGLREEAR